ncbi:Flagellar biosynthesis protein FliQ [Candidatus Syntrophocurvum alkaliphilum]|uniref:Flagellar biosynthetic protein FliQ n=1 Tax=Candidatus Syntrophocurvum alkaliphilum TaxID=2293317 RepID=A0A6I6DDP9_9FIRM|nr:flagellar biosynthesis protein FliQ [Candidatus Syntrophocurvum alkaliphilum]QGT99180.1 Flagellar biosynthesis protein FliQ [Candidatus Syntrophocurvum alkaliphilum]
MFEDVVLGIANRGVLTALLVATPILAAALLTGLLIAIMQATTQIQEMTLVFVPKIIAVLLIIVLFGPWMMNVITSFAIELYVSIPELITM